MNMLSNWILRKRVGNGEGDGGTLPRIRFYSWPFSKTQTEKSFDDTVSGLLIAIFLMFAVTFIPIGTSYNIVNDRVNLTKHQQLVSGVSCVSYWTANYLMDFFLALPACLLIWVMVHAFNSETFLGTAQGPFILILLLFSLSIIPFTYLLSSLFKSGDKAQVAIGVSYIILGVFLLMIWHLTDALLPKFWADFLDGFYEIFPTFIMSRSMFNVATISFAEQAGQTVNPYDWDIIGKDLVIMACEAVGYFVLVLLVEYGLLYKNSIEKWWNGSCTMCTGDVLSRFESPTGDDMLDDDVLAEKQRIQNLVEHRELIQERGAGGDRNRTPSNGDRGNVVHDSAAMEIEMEEKDMDRVVMANLNKLYRGGKCCGPQTDSMQYV